MEFKFIKFIERDEQDLKLACKLAEDNGYKKRIDWSALNFEWKWILELNDSWLYFTSKESAKELIEQWYTELKRLYFIRGEMVIDEDWDEVEFIFDIWEADKSWDRYIVKGSNWSYFFTTSITKLSQTEVEKAIELLIKEWIIKEWKIINI